MDGGHRSVLGFPLLPVLLGTKVHAPSAFSDVVTAIRQTVGVMFWMLESSEAFWTARIEVVAAPTFGADHDLTLEAVRINRKKIHQMFQTGVVELAPILKPILSEETFASIQQIAALAEPEFRFPDELWVRVLYQFAVSYHRSVMNRDHLIQALTPLYRGRMYSFLLEHHDSTAEQIEASTQLLCQEFVRQKPYLVEQWKGRE